MTKPNPSARKPSPIFVGSRFGRWIVESQADSTPTGQKRWNCRCECGGAKAVEAQWLRSGASKSCGCLARDAASERATKHGAKRGNKGTPEYNAWNAMIQRCTRESHPAFKNYGGRGITVCDEWRHDFTAFLAHIGARPSVEHSLDRIDNDRGYEPGNVRWTTYDVQMKNRRLRSRNGEGRFA